ncbi:hypothetical protein HMN09_00648000 [Mycena chlorophos]|uniref:aminodeoxychorismate synthase n=1 Tax=Mycena chlorophos TaxID=658473 RepID=A0A8H6T2U0_MYCCL|nr:hypothetical protein HMN09_00648000 [Mycena chlorophos]
MINNWLPRAPKILLIDSYDSFTYNVVSLCKQAIPGCSIYVIHNDQLTISHLTPYISCFDALVVGPGPGNPTYDSDVGVIKHLWNLDIPIFGVCLGLQSLGHAFGAKVERLNVVKHGQVSRIHHADRDLFKNVDTVDAVRYHSLHVVLPKCSVPLEVLAWTEDEENGRVVMALRHVSKPFWAVQYHPESVLTRGGGLEVVQSFWCLAQQWNAENKRAVSPWPPNMTGALGSPWPALPSRVGRSCFPREPRPRMTVEVLHLQNLTAATVCELFGVHETEDTPFVLLDSAAQPGRYSIIGSLLPTSLQILYHLRDDHVTLARGHQTEKHRLENGIWAWLSNFMTQRRVEGVDPRVPFAGGLIGSLSYELGVRELEVPLAHPTGGFPDVNLVFVERSVVIDSQTGQVYVQSLIPDDSWVAETAQALRSCAPKGNSCSTSVSTTSSPTVVIPEKERYLSRIVAAKEFISSGDSYELCFTARTSIKVSKPPQQVGSHSWQRYKTLRSRNPAPYSAYLRLHPTTFLSSSPERFMSVSRPPDPVFHLRPIKGTVRKAPGVTRHLAEQLLAGSVKEVAENLMIVDLITNDLHTLVGEDVHVRQFCRVEEYETVWQLVSVIEGRLQSGSPEASDPESQLGWDMLRMSLPPGSMTGAPKKRSVDILQQLEDGPRNMYSGVFGYWCVTGAADWSVAIRSCFKLHQESESNADSETWYIGAGGAITALSDAEAEWEEMIAKLQSVMGAF